MLEILFGIALLCAFGYFFYQLTQAFFHSMQVMVESTNETNKKYYDMVTGLQIDHEKQMTKMQEGFLKAMTKSEKSVVQKVQDVINTETNEIEKKEEDDIPINESVRIPIPSVAHVQFEDETEINDVSIS